MFKLSCFVMLAASIPWMSPAHAGNYALLVGVSHYEDVNVTNLAYPATYAEMIGGALERERFTADPKCIRVLKTIEETRRKRIWDELEKLDRDCGSAEGGSGTGIFFFAGHGIDAGAKNKHLLYGKKNASQSREFLAPSDTMLSDITVVGSGQYENRSFISKDELVSRLTALRIKRVAVVLSTCHREVVGDRVKFLQDMPESRRGATSAALRRSDGSDRKSIHYLQVWSAEEQLNVTLGEIVSTVISSEFESAKGSAGTKWSKDLPTPCTP